MNNKLID